MSSHDVRWMGGLETEYALSAIGDDGTRLGGGCERLFELAHRVLPSLPDGSSSGMFLTNGARFYPDAGGHPEMSTPETTDPWETVRYAMAGDRIVAGLAEEVVRSDPTVHEMIVTRCNVDYSGTRNTWGSHESYLHRCAPGLIPRHLVPHFVSRIIFTGAGGFDNRAVGPEFVLSPRVPHLRHVESCESTSSRGIFHTKNESLCRQSGYHRMHVLCGESLCSQTAAVLRVGTTALVLALVDAGKRPGLEVALEDPLDAMRRFARDPTGTVTAPGVRGKKLRALEIQRHYLASVERHLDADFLPVWAEEICSEWRRVLELLEEGPEAVSTRLDWSIKLSLFQSHCRRRGFEWESLPAWTREAKRSGALPDPALISPEALELDELRLLARVRRSREAALQAERRSLLARLRRPGAPPHRPDSEFGNFLRLTHELYEIDTRVSQLGPHGIFAGLDEAGLLAHRLARVGDPESAVTAPPERGRARLRGEAVLALAPKRASALADWSTVHDMEGGRSLDLSDPFTETPSWRTNGSLPRSPRRRRSREGEV